MATRPTQLRRETGLRRRSALDQPSSMIQNRKSAEVVPKISETVEPVASTEGTEYEPENSLRRRKTSDQSKPGGKERARRNGMVATTPMKPTKKPLTSEEVKIPKITEIASPEESSDSGFSDRSPVSPSPAVLRKQPLSSLSIPEDYAISNGGSLTTASPRHRRRVSYNLPPQMAPNRGPATLPSPITDSPKLNRQSPISTSPTTPPARVRKTSVDIQNASKSIKARRSSLSALSQPPTSSVAMSASRKKSSTTTPVTTTEAKAIPSRLKRRRNREESCTSHINAERYWNWYLLHASYSWKNFNNHRLYGY